jgi:hypothetical protein
MHGFTGRGALRTYPIEPGGAGTLTALSTHPEVARLTVCPHRISSAILLRS